MNLYTRFNNKQIADRQIDTLIGISKGLVSDNKINQAEAEFLQSWLQQACAVAVDNPVMSDLLNTVNRVLEDGVLDHDEAEELLNVLSQFSGERSEGGELMKTSGLPVDEPMPAIQFSGSTFLFTGLCKYGSRSKCQELVESLGGTSLKGVTRSLNYLVLGTYVNDSWVHENFGRKIEKAMSYRDDGTPLVIVTEEHWLQEAGV